MSALSRFPCGLLSPAGGRRCNYPSFHACLEVRTQCTHREHDERRATLSNLIRSDWRPLQGARCFRAGRRKVGVGVFDGDGPGVIMSQSRQGPQPQTTHLEKGGGASGGRRRSPGRTASLLDVEAHEIRPSSLDIGWGDWQRHVGEDEQRHAGLHGFHLSSHPMLCCRG